MHRISERKFGAFFLRSIRYCSFAPILCWRECSGCSRYEVTDEDCCEGAFPDYYGGEGDILYSYHEI